MRIEIIFRRTLCLLAWLLLTACQQSTDVALNPTASELMIRDLNIGDGRTATSGMTAVVHYTGWLFAPDAADNRGEKFDSSLDRGDPFQFDLGAKQVIRGWDDGVVGMKTGGRRELIIPPELAYGSSGAGGVIPPNATLVFEVELIDLR